MTAYQGKQPIVGAYNPGPKFAISSGYIFRNDPKNAKHLHKGIDFAAALGTPISAAASGIVVFVNKDKTDPMYQTYGNYVILKHGTGVSAFYTLYAHMSATPPVALGSVMQAGQWIGNVGKSGPPDTGVHLHFEVIPGSVAPTKKGHETRDPLTFIGWGDLPHMIGTDVLGNALVARGWGAATTIYSVALDGSVVPGSISQIIEPPGGVFSGASSGWEVNSEVQQGYLYNNGVFYRKDTVTTQEFWSIPATTGGTQEVTQFSTGLITTVTYTADGQLDTTNPATVSLDASASADVKAAFDAWVAAGNDPSNVNPADLHLDQTAGGVTILLDSRLFSWAGGEYSNNAVLIGESPASGTGGDMLRGGIGNDLLIGSSGADVLYGGGHDLLVAGAGVQKMPFRCIAANDAERRMAA